MAIINNKHKFIFVHVPKAAGTSVSQYFAQLNTIADVEIGGTHIGEVLQGSYLKRYRIGKHATAEQLRGALGIEYFATFTKFAFVRHPVSRTLSTFRFLKGWLPKTSLHEHIRVFSDFRTVSDMLKSDYWKTSAGPDRIFNPQVFWLCDASGHLLVDHVGRVEQMKFDMQAFNLRLGVDLPDFDVVANKSAPCECVSDLSSEDLASIQRRYEEDYRLFGYT